MPFVKRNFQVFLICKKSHRFLKSGKNTQIANKLATLNVPATTLLVKVRANGNLMDPVTGNERKKKRKSARRDTSRKKEKV